MARMVILGCAGAGKSHLTRRLSALTGAPAIILDDIWQKGWGEAQLPAFRETMRAAHAGEAWISDGNFAAATFDIRLPRATAIVWLERPRLGCAWRATARVLRKDSGHRARDLLQALRFIAGFERINRPRIEALRVQHASAVPVHRLRSVAQIEAFLAAPMA